MSDRALALINNPAMNAPSHFCGIVFDGLPPGDYSTEGVRTGDSDKPERHYRTLGRFMLEAADCNEKDKHPCRSLVVDLLLARLLTYVSDAKMCADIQRAALGIAWPVDKLRKIPQVGTWRGYPIYLDVRLPEGSGAMLDARGEPGCGIRVANVYEANMRMLRD